jgi:predicted HTH transcriptional regulator
METDAAFAEELRTNIPPEDQQLEYKTVLPPPFTLAREIAAFANAEGGRLVLGIADERRIVGLEPDVPVRDILASALALTIPSPAVTAYPLTINDRLVYVLDIRKSPERVLVGGEREFLREDIRVRQIAPERPPLVLPTDYPRLAALMERIERELANGY